MKRLRSKESNHDNATFVEFHQNIYHYGFCFVRISKEERNIVAAMQKVASDFFEALGEIFQRFPGFGSLLAAKLDSSIRYEEPRFRSGLKCF